MKVYIGPYRNWYTTTKLETVLDKYIGEIWSEKIGDWLQPILNWTVNWNSSKDQKKKIVIHNYDVWSMDHTLANIIHPMLVKLKENKQGSPHIDDEDVPEYLKSTNAPTKENDWDIDNNHHLRWEYILNEMIWAFHQKTIEWEDQYHSGVIDFKFEKISDDPNGNYEMLKGPNDTHEFDKEGFQKHQDRMSNGFKLFGKYFEALWD